ncbi:MAG: pyridoxal-dependent decarboxylase [Patescibacteria group bacterium]|nr:pyridoxal-dependent decarboxylase [Patescibacteria group bacterium]
MIGKVKKRISQILENDFFSEDTFPQYGTPRWKIDFRLNRIFSELKERKLKNLIGELYNLPNNLAVDVWNKFLPQNPNNLGNWSYKSLRNKKLFATYQIEKEVILQIISLLNSKKESLEGYVTSGATEGNIFSAWTGRKYLQRKFKNEQICLLCTDLSHYSVSKSADITNIAKFTVAVDKSSWSMSLSSLNKLLLSLYSKGYRGFLIACTLGHTIGGTNDDIDGIHDLLENFKKERSDVDVFLSLDAALSGSTIPFIKPVFHPFSLKYVQTFIIDFHKFPGIPYPAGVILYRAQLRTLIEQETYYLKQKDNTLLGSRTGIASTAIWAIIQHYGKTGFQKIILESIKRKNKFLSELNSKTEGISIITDQNAVNAALIVKKPLPKSLCDKYGLYLTKYPITFENKKEIVKLYKLFFLPEH